MDVQEALQEINQGTLSPLYLVLGTEAYLIERIRQAFQKKLQIADEEDLNFLAFDLNEASLDAVLDEAETLPFFGDYRLVFVENPLFLTADKKAALEENLTKRFMNYVKDPAASTVLVLFAPYEKLDERKKLTKALKKNSVVIDAKPPKEAEVRRYLQQTLKNDGMTMDRQNVELFLRLTDFQLSKVMQELPKLYLNTLPNKEISKETIQALVPKTLDENIFELTEYVLKKDTAAALRLYDDLHLQGIETIKLAAILIGQFRLLLQTKILQQAGYQQSSIAETLGIHPYRVKLALQQVRSLDFRQLASMYDRLVENDYRIKTGQVEKEYQFQLFLLEATA